MSFTIEQDEFIEASQAIVFIDRHSNLAFKVFKSYQHPSSDKSDYSEPEFNLYKQRIYLSEQEAYKLISESSVSQYFAKYHEEIVIDKITDKKGNDISHQFLLDCTLTLDFILGEAIKQSEFRLRECCKKNGVDLQSVFDELKTIGVNFYIDSSVFCNETGIKIVDIATKDFSEFQPPPSEINDSDDPYQQLRKE